MTTYYARKEYNYSGGDAVFGIPFDYIKKEHISVSVNGEATENYTYLNNSQIQITDTLTVGDVVTIARTTPISSKMVVFSDTSILNKDTQNLAQDQVFDAVQEIYDNNIVFEAGVDSDIDTISTVANTALTNSNTAINTANTADSKADNAVSTANSANSKADNAVSTANTASNNATAAVNTANTASQNATTAVNTANSADSKADTAISTANTAKSTADTAKSTADTALSNSATALSNSQTAVSTANTAKNTADSAKITAESAASDAADAVSTANSASDVADAASDKVDEFGEDIEAVIEAAEKINELEEAVQTAVDAAGTASDKATIATNKATEATNAAAAAQAAIPSQTGHNGQFLKTNGTNTSWETVDALPSQTGNAGKFLTTDGTDASWDDVDAYTKAQTDTLLDAKIPTDSVISPLEYSVTSSSVDCINTNGTLFWSKNNTIGESYVISYYDSNDGSIYTRTTGSPASGIIDTNYVITYNGSLSDKVIQFTDCNDSDYFYGATTLGCYIGNTDSDGVFTPYFCIASDSSYNYKFMELSGITRSQDDYGYGFTKWQASIRSTSNSFYRNLYNPLAWKVKITVADNNGVPNFTINTYLKDGSGGATVTYTPTYNTDITQLNTVVFPMYNYQASASQYNYNIVDWGIFDNQGNQTWSVADVSYIKNLKLNIGTGLDVQNGNLVTTGAALPSQTGQSGKYLTTNGTSASWDNVLTHNLFDFKWVDHLLNDQSWLRADTFSWQSGATYTDVYNHLVSDISGITAETETIGSYTVTFYRATDGHKVALADQEQTVLNIYNAYGIAWYYILDTTNTQFKLPRTKFGFEGLRNNVGDKIDETLPNFTGSFGTTASWGDGVLFQPTDSGGWSGTVQQPTNCQGLLFNPHNVNSTYQDNAPVQERATQMYLYFYVGEFNQTATQQTAGLNSELFNGKADINLSNINPTQTIKNTIIGWGIPDYSLGVSKTWGTTYTADANGWIYMQEYVIGNSTRSGQLTIDGVVVAFDYAEWNDTECHSHFVPIASGSTYVASGGTYGQAITFYPCKGGQ